MPCFGRVKPHWLSAYRQDGMLHRMAALLLTPVLLPTAQTSALKFRLVGGSLMPRSVCWHEFLCGLSGHWFYCSSSYRPTARWVVFYFYVFLFILCLCEEKEIYVIRFPLFPCRQRDPITVMVELIIFSSIHMSSIGLSWLALGRAN